MPVTGVVRERVRAQWRPDVVLAGLLLLAWWVTLSATPAAAAQEADAGETTPLFLTDDDRLHEASGIALSRRHRLLWLHNDAGNDPVLFGVRPTGATHARITVGGAAAEDWEDIAVATVDGRDWIYLNDVGDAYQVRKERGRSYRRQFEVVRFPEPDRLPRDADVQVTAEVFPVVFEDREGVNVEAMAVQESGAILLVEKLEAGGRPARVWHIERPARDRTNVPVVVAEIPVIGVTGADLSVDGASLVVRDADTALEYDLRRGIRKAVAAPVRRHALPGQDQGEGVAFTLDGRGLLLSGEGQSQAVWFVPFDADAVPLLGPLVADPGSPATRGAPGRADALRSTMPAWLSDVRVVRSLAVLTGALVLGVGAAGWMRRRAARSARRSPPTRFTHVPHTRYLDGRRDG